MRLECEWRHARKRWADHLGILKNSQLETRCRTESQQQTEGLGPQRPTVEQPSQGEKEVLLGQYSSLSPSPAHLSHTTNINPFENKVGEIYFYKEVFVRSLLLTMFPLIFVLYIYMWLYNKKTKSYILKEIALSSGTVEYTDWFPVEG